MADEKREPTEVFAKWWSNTSPSLPDCQSEATARVIWDAAIREAVSLIDNDVNRLVRDASYHAAASLRDYRSLVEALFTSPGQWNHLTPMHENETDRAISLFRGLSNDRITEAASKARAGTTMSLAAALVLLERQERHTP